MESYDPLLINGNVVIAALSLDQVPDAVVDIVEFAIQSLNDTFSLII
jgi:hypothetical protein